MTGFGRTGEWFGLDHWGVTADILVAAKGATSGYWPFGFVAASGAIHDAVVGAGGFVHGFTYSHAPGGAVVAREVLRILEEERLVEASRTKGERLADLLHERLAPHPNLGEIRGRGLMVGLELVADRSTRAPFPRADRLTERVVRAARDAGVLVYSGTGNANGIDGDTILLGPPFIVTDAELERIADVVGGAVETATGPRRSADPRRTRAQVARLRLPTSRRMPIVTRISGNAIPEISGWRISTAPSSPRIEPHISCQPHPPPRTARTAAMNRNASPKQSVPQPGPRLVPVAAS